MNKKIRQANRITFNYILNQQEHYRKVTFTEEYEKAKEINPLLHFFKHAGLLIFPHIIPIKIAAIHGYIHTGG